MNRKGFPGYLQPLMDFVTSETAYPKIITGTGPTVDPEVEMGGRRVIQMSSPNYLGLSNHPEVNEAAIRAIHKYGLSTNGSRIVSGNVDAYDELETMLAGFMCREAAVVFSDVSSLSRAIVSMIMDPYLFPLIDRGFNRQALGTRAIFFDRANHESLKEAVQLARGSTLGDRTMADTLQATPGVDVFRYRHCDVKHLEELLAASRHDTKLIITDGYFSADADLAPLPSITDLAERHRAMVLVDDAHGSFMLGAHGRGTAEEMGVEERVQFNVHSLSKAAGVRLGFLAADRQLVDYLRVSRGYIFSGASSPALVTAAMKAIQIATAEPERRKRALANGEQLRQGLKALGYEVLGEKHIVPWMIGDESTAVAVYHDLFELGIFAPTLRYPSMPMGKAIIRFMLMATHTAEHIERTLQACRVVGRRHNVAVLA